ncbi:MAG: gliding motility-associated-like protein [Thalassomonas sp.]|jgi:gliding motility-associated-like protein
MKKILLILFLTLPQIVLAQSSDCANADGFCTGTNYTFPASTNTTAPVGPDYGCLGTQPNPAFYFLQIDQPGNLTITMQSTPLVDIDFICWGPFNDPATMCDSLTGAYIEDCSYSTAAIEDCDITNAVVGQYYVLLITNYSNTNCNIDFSQTGGNGTTNCCIDGDAGIDNTVDFCETDPSFILESQLNGSPNPGGVWYDNSWGTLASNNFDPSLLINGTFSYIVQGTPVPGATVTCPNDTSFLTINSNLNPTINFPTINDLCSDNPAINLTATPTGGIYTGNGLAGNIFTPSVSLIGNNTITYSFTDANGCNDTENETIKVNELPIVILGNDSTIPCRASVLINPIVTNGTTPYSYLWSDGSTGSILTVEDGSISITVTDDNGCIAIDQIIITQDITPIATISGGGEICNDGTTTTINFSFSGLLPWNLTYTNGSFSSTVNNINYSNYSLLTSTPGQYNITLADDINTCEADIIGSNINIILNPIPYPVINPDFYEIYSGERIELSAGTYAYYWWYNDNDSLLSEDEYLIADSSLTTYIIVETDKGCIGTSTNAIVQFIPRVELYIPNTFTPNGDEHNDLFVIIGNEISSFNMAIMNRWGKELYRTNNIDKFWDGRFEGKIVQQGTYTYSIEIIGEDKRAFSKTGTINVIY